MKRNQPLDLGVVLQAFARFRPANDGYLTCSLNSRRAIMLMNFLVFMVFLNRFPQTIS